MTEYQKDIAMYGCTTEDILEAMENAITGAEFLAISIMSDAQVMIEMGRGEEARQFINRAKFIMFKNMEKRWEA